MTISFKKSNIYKRLLADNRDVAQLGSASGLGPEGRRFESCFPDHEVNEVQCKKHWTFFFLKEDFLSFFLLIIFLSFGKKKDVI